MKACISLGRSFAWLAVSMSSLPSEFAAAVSPAATANAIRTASVDQIGDVALSSNGLLTGRVVNAQSIAQPGADVTILSSGQTIATTQTDANGVFAVTGLRGGVHQVATEHGTYTCRLWAPGTAPPGAGQALEVGGDSVIARGQWGPPPAANNFVRKAKVMATNPFVIGGVVAAAVAIPVAIHNADQDDGPSS